MQKNKTPESIPVSWIQKYARDCGVEVGEILECMVEAYRNGYLREEGQV